MPSETMTHRERFLRTMRGQPVDRLPDYEFGCWSQTVDRWETEGLVPRKGPYGGDVFDIVAYSFDSDEAEFGPQPKVAFDLFPIFEEQILEETGTHQILIQSDGALVERLDPDLGATIPRYLRYAIETRADWERIRDERLDPTHPARFKFDVAALSRYLANHGTYPVRLGVLSLYGMIRNWMGMEGVALALYDDPEWVEEMMEHLTRLQLSLLQHMAGKITIDHCQWWEDMCYNHGPLISPKDFARLMVPRYRRVVDFMRHELGCEHHQVDCDGNIHKLVPLWLDAGIRIMMPLEVRHTDAVRLANEYGNRAFLLGAYDKFAMIAGPEAIDQEFERLRPLRDRGGFIPHTDHLVPPDVSLENYLYYRRRKCEFIGKEWREPAAVRVKKSNR